MINLLLGFRVCVNVEFVGVSGIPLLPSTMSAHILTR